MCKVHPIDRQNCSLQQTGKACHRRAHVGRDRRYGETDDGRKSRAPPRTQVRIRSRDGREVRSAPRRPGEPGRGMVGSLPVEPLSELGGVSRTLAAFPRGQLSKLLSRRGPRLFVTRSSVINIGFREPQSARRFSCQPPCGFTSLRGSPSLYTFGSLSLYMPLVAPLPMPVVLPGVVTPGVRRFDMQWEDGPSCVAPVS